MIITGGAGFIGSNFVRLALAETEGRVTVLDNLTYAGHQASLEEVADHPRYRFVRGDIRDRDLVRTLLSEERPSAILNFAAESHVDRSIDSPGEFVQTNVVGTFELLEAARGYYGTLSTTEAEAFRFLHVSTDEVYGSLGATGLFEETTPYAPNSPYSASKAAADHLVRAYFHTYGLPVLITNCSNNYGPFQFPEKLIPAMILNAVEGRPLPIYGTGENVRDWIYVEDHCRGILLALQKGRLGEKYNLGGENERTNLEVVDRICEIVGELVPATKNPSLTDQGHSTYTDLKVFVTDRPGHDMRYAIDASKAQAELGWRAKHDFESGLQETVQWYLDHERWCLTVQGKVFDRQRLGLSETPQDED